MMNRRFVVAVTVTGVVLLASCKSGGAKLDATPVSEEEYRTAAEQAVNAVLITESDLPANFDLTIEDDEEDQKEPDFLLTGECAEFNEYFKSDTDWRDAVVESKTDDYEGPDGDEFSSSAAAFRDPDTARDEVAAMERFFDTCTDEFEATFTQYLDDSLQELALEEGKDVTDVGVEVSEISVPSQGDWTHAVRMDMAFTVDGLPLRLVSDTLTVRVGRMVASVDATYTGELESALESLRDGIVATITARLAVEEAKLPT